MDIDAIIKSPPSNIPQLPSTQLERYSSSILPGSRPEAPNLFGLRITHGKTVHPISRDRIKVTITEDPASYAKLEAILDQVAIAISKPATIINMLRVLIIGISSLVMSASMVVNSRIPASRMKKKKDRKTRYGLHSHPNHPEIGGLIDLLARKSFASRDRPVISR